MDRQADQDKGHWGGMKRHSHRWSPIRIAGMVVVGVVLAAGFALAFGWLVMILWNWLMPAIFGLKLIGYWQAFGLVLLVKLLFGGMHGARHGRGPGRRGWRTPEGNGPDGWHHGNCGGHGWMKHGTPENWKHFRKYWEEKGR